MKEESFSNRKILSSLFFPSSLSEIVLREVAFLQNREIYR
jgi:hypothetical protein